MKWQVHDSAWRRIAVLLFLLLGIVCLFIRPRSAYAHANLIRSNPRANEVLETAPSELRLEFSESVEVRFSQVQVLDKTGQSVKDGLGPLHLAPNSDKVLLAPFAALPRGVYTVIWRVLSSVDGHLTSGGFVFIIGRDQAPAENATLPAPTFLSPDDSSNPAVSEVITRWLNYVAMAVLLGGFAFAPLVFQPALANASSAQRKRNQEQAATLPGSFSRDTGLFRLLIMCWLLLLLVTLVGAVLQTVKSTGGDFLTALGTPLLSFLTNSRFGTLFWIRLLLVIAVGALLAFRRSRFWQQTMASRWWWAGILLIGCVMLTTSLGSHAAAQTFLATIADWLHLIAVGIWVGGLVALLLTLLWLRRSDSSEFIVTFLIARFSQLATICVIVLGITGIYQALIEVVDTANLIDTPYGTAFAIKLLLVVPLLGLGAVNLLFIQRRLMQTVDDPNATQPLKRLIRRTVGGEILFVCAVLLITGLLTSLPPSRDAFGAGPVARGQAGDLRVVLTVNPGVWGLNTFTVYIKDNVGRPVNGAEKVALIFGMVEHDMGQTEVVAEKRGDGVYVAQSGGMSMFGTWRAEVLVRRAGQEDARTALIIPIRASVRQLTTSASFVPVLIYPSRLILALVVFASAVVLLARTRRLYRARQWAGQLGLIGSIIMLSASVALTSGAFLNGADSAATNPVPVNAETFARGKLMYEANCSVCHGMAGLGDGEAGIGLNPPPANLRVHLAQGHSDSQLFEWISQGIDNTAMPAFEGRLVEEDRWKIINYIRTFASPQ